MNKLKTFVVFGLLMLLSFSLDAQCSQCKAIAESSTQAGSSVATGLNAGILYLMLFPYLILTVLGIAIYRHKKSQSAKASLGD